MWPAVPMMTLFVELFMNRSEDASFFEAEIQMLRETRVRVKSKPFLVAALNELRFCGRNLFNDCLCRRSWVIGSNDGPAHHNVIRARFDGFSRCRRAGLIILFSAGGFLRRANARRDDQKFVATCFPDGFGFLYGGHRSEEHTS